MAFYINKDAFYIDEKLREASEEMAKELRSILPAEAEKRMGQFLTQIA